MVTSYLDKDMVPMEGPKRVLSAEWYFCLQTQYSAGRGKLAEGILLACGRLWLIGQSSHLLDWGLFCGRNLA